MTTRQLYKLARELKAQQGILIKRYKALPLTKLRLAIGSALVSS